MRVEYFSSIRDFLEFLFWNENMRNYVLVYKRLIVRYRDYAYAIWIFHDFLGNTLVIKYRKEEDKQLWIVALI